MLAYCQLQHALNQRGRCSPFPLVVFHFIQYTESNERRDSFIINRLWAAMKRETLMILAEGVTDPKEIDELFVRHPFLFGAHVRARRILIKNLIGRVVWGNHRPLCGHGWSWP